MNLMSLCSVDLIKMDRAEGEYLILNSGSWILVTSIRKSK